MHAPVELHKELDVQARVGWEVALLKQDVDRDLAGNALALGQAGADDELAAAAIVKGLVRPGRGRGDVQGWRVCKLRVCASARLMDGLRAMWQRASTHAQQAPRRTTHCVNSAAPSR
jgi:hypothetical protein